MTADKLNRKLMPALLGLTLAGAAAAQSLPPGGSTATPGTTAVAAPHLVGLVVLDERVPFSFGVPSGIVSGEIEQRVIRSDFDNTLDFYWQIRNDATSTARIDQIEVLNFVTTAGLVANYRSDTLGSIGSDFARRSAGLGDKISFFAANGVGPGEQSHWLMLDSKEFSMAPIGTWQLGAIGGGNSPLFGTYVPGVVPEPTSWALLAGGLLVLGRRLRRRAAG